MLKIFQAEIGKDLGMIKMLFAEYADSLGFDLDFQDFENELANLPGDYAEPAGCLLLAIILKKETNEAFEYKDKSIPFRKRCLLGWLCGCK